MNKPEASVVPENKEEKSNKGVYWGDTEPITRPLKYQS